MFRLIPAGIAFATLSVLIGTQAQAADGPVGAADRALFGFRKA